MFKESPVIDHGAPGLVEATWEILIMLLVAAILGYLIRWAVGKIRLNKLRTEMNELTSESLRWRNQLNEKSAEADKANVKLQNLSKESMKMRSELSECKRQRAAIEAELLELKSKPMLPNETHSALQKPDEVEMPDDPLVAFVSGVKPSTSPQPKRPVSPKPDQVDDLKRIEGVGPKIEEHLNNGGIWNYQQLSTARVTYLREILDAAGPAYTIHDPGTWPEQALLCRDGKWEELTAWQSKLKGGRRRLR